MPKITLIILILCFSQNLLGQNCENTDFAYGDFTNWTGHTGVCCGGPIAIPGIVSGRHTIITTSTLDPNTNNTISTMPPSGGGAYSVRLGNDNVGGEAESLTRSFVVNADNQLFVYQYAVVLQDPSGHSVNDKPKFEVQVFDQNGITVNPPECGYYQVTAGPQTNSWGQYNNVRYKDWSTVGIDLSQYFGTLVTIKFTTQDCGLGGHFGYAYLDASCGYLDLETIGFCEGSTSVTLAAPDGFDSYFWPSTGDSSQTTIISYPNVGDSISVEVTNQSGCVTTILHVFEQDTVAIANASNDTLICVGQEVDLWSDGGVANGYFDWYVNGNHLSSQQNITVAPLETTTYDVIVANGNGCYSPDSLASVTVTVDTTLFFTLANDTTICLGEGLEIAGPIGNFNYNWYTDSTTIATSANLVDTPLVTTTYYLEISNSVCSYMDSIVVEPYPFQVETYNIIPPALEICQGESATLSLDPSFHSSVQWYVDGILGETSGSILQTPLSTSEYYAEIIDTNGCQTSAATTITVYPVPMVNLGPDVTLCDDPSLTLGSSITQDSVNYTWSTSEQTSEITVYSTGTYELTVDLNNCYNSDEIYVEFLPKSYIGTIPNVITANNDDINDEFWIDQANLSEYEIIIQNRWGEIVFQTNDPNNSWNGTTNDTDVSAGVYFYKIVYRLRCEEETRNLHGNITVTR